MKWLHAIRLSLLSPNWWHQSAHVWIEGYMICGCACVFMFLLAQLLLIAVVRLVWFSACEWLANGYASNLHHLMYCTNLSDHNQQFLVFKMWSTAISSAYKLWNTILLQTSRVATINCTLEKRRKRDWQNDMGRTCIYHSIKMKNSNWNAPHAFLKKQNSSNS